jgi:hypothetical protein
MSAPTASCLPSTEAKEAGKYVIVMVLDFNPVDDCPLWLALINDAMDKSRVNLYNQWLWLTPDDILTLQYCPELSKQKIVPLSWGYHTHVTRFTAMYFELQCTPGWTDLDIFKITYDEYMAFSRQYMAGQITPNPLSLAPNLYASSTDPVALFTKSTKREPEDFPVIKSLNQWDSVKRVVKAMATVQSIAEVLNHTYIPSAGNKPTSITVTGTRSLLTLSRSCLSGPLSMLVLLEMDKLFGRTSLQRTKIYDGSYYIAIAHCLPHHFQDSRWLLAGYRHCVS